MPNSDNSPRYDVIAIGNAIVDVMAPCDDALIEELQLAKGGMSLIDADGARDLYKAMGPAKEISGGSAANTLAGLANLGAQCAFIGQVAKDQLGDVFSHDICAAGIDLLHEYLGESATVVGSRVTRFQFDRRRKVRHRAGEVL